MNVDLDKYVRNFRIFYSKVVTRHPQKVALQKKFKLLLQNQSTKWRSSMFDSNNQENSNSVKTYLNKARQTQKKSQNPTKKHEWLMETNHFSRAFVFVCVMSLLEVKSKQGIQMIRAHLQNQGLLEEGKTFNGAIMRKITYGWSKIEKLFVNTLNSKPYLSLSECLNDFPEEFIDALYDILTDKKVPKLEQGEITEAKMSILIDTIKVNLTYFEFENNKIQLIKKCGNFKKNAYIGYLPDDKIYVVAKQLPKKHKDEAQSKTLTNLSKISNDLFKMYQTSDAKIKNLQFVISSTKLKDSRNFGFQSSSLTQSSLKRKGSLAMSASRI